MEISYPWISTFDAPFVRNAATTLNRVAQQPTQQLGMNSNVSFKLAEGTPRAESERRGAAKAKNSAAYLPHMGLWAVA